MRSATSLCTITVACDPDTRMLAARVADAAFAQRRKTIRNSLRATLGESAQAIDDALENAGIDGKVRAETLEPEAFIELARSFRNAR